MVDLAPWIGLVGVVVGVILGAAVEEWRARRSRRWQQETERDARLRDLQLRRIGEAKNVLVSRLDWIQALAVGDPRRLEEAERSLSSTAFGWIDLLADERLIREYAAVLTEFQNRVGTGLSAHDVSRLTTLGVGVIRALNEQEELVLSGRPPAELPDEVRKALDDPNTGITAGLVPSRVSPTLAGRMARIAARLPRSQAGPKQVEVTRPPSGAGSDGEVIR